MKKFKKYKYKVSMTPPLRNKQNILGVFPIYSHSLLCRHNIGIECIYCLCQVLRFPLRDPI